MKLLATCITLLSTLGLFQHQQLFIHAAAHGILVQYVGGQNYVRDSNACIPMENDGENLRKLVFFKDVGHCYTYDSSDCSDDSRDADLGEKFTYDSLDENDFGDAFPNGAVQCK